MNGPDEFMSRFRVAMSFLAEVEKDRGLLVELSDADRIELLRLCGAISLPNRGDKKKLNKAFGELGMQGIVDNDPIVLYYGGKIGDIFRITRKAMIIDGEYSMYRKVIKNPEDKSRKKTKKKVVEKEDEEEED